MNIQSQPIDAKVWINSLPYNSNKTLGYFAMLNCKHVVFGNVISGLTLYTKLKLKSHKVNKSKGKSQWLTLLKFHYS
jgi:cyclophilin family peptidyl-prolyl cis-trans isomerase